MLSSGTCSVQFMSSDEYSGTFQINAAYSGDSIHYLSNGNSAVYVTSSDN